MLPSVPLDVDPIANVDPLLDAHLRDALDSFLGGDYHAALERLKDARAIGRVRADMVPVHAFEAALESALDLGVISSRDAAPARRA